MGGMQPMGGGMQPMGGMQPQQQMAQPQQQMGFGMQVRRQPNNFSCRSCLQPVVLGLRLVTWANGVCGCCVQPQQQQQGGGGLFKSW